MSQFRAAAAVLMILLVWNPRPALAAEKPDISALPGRPDEWYRSDEGRKIVDNILTWQNEHGGWWKAYDASKPRDGKLKRVSTFDNKATYSELRVLARAYRVTQEARYRDAFERGLKYVFDAQYPNGGWPQRFPPDDEEYARHITFNDNAMTGVMLLLKDVADAKTDFAWLDSDRRALAAAAFARGLECVLNTQIKASGKLTGWCQQHDAQTLAPAGARTYELPCISGGETCGIVLMLMHIEQPDERVKHSIRSAVAWLEASKITGKRLEERRDPSLPKGKDRVVVDDPSAPPLWARCYDIETNRPFFCGRDGVKKWSLAEIEPERRTGYAWLRPFAAEVMKQYPKWDAKHAAGRS